MRAVTIAAIAGVLAAAPMAALADQQAADKCAANLTPQGKMIYDRALPRVAEGGELEKVVRNATTRLVQLGDLPRADARDAAMAAGRCLFQL